jgi:FolB domain-containing protein
MPLLETEIPFHALRIQDLRYQLRLGLSREERERPQEVGVTVEFRFLATPSGVFSDTLDGTICYAALNDALARHFHGKEYCLVEKVAGEVFLISRELSRGRARVAVAVHKRKPPVENLAGGAVFSCGEFSL